MDGIWGCGEEDLDKHTNVAKSTCVAGQYKNEVPGRSDKENNAGR